MSPPDLPPALADRPVDAGTGLPVPFVNEIDGGDHDFTAINGRRAVQCALSRVCGICGRPLEYQIAFLGDHGAAAARRYTQPPMHVACAEAAIRLCPHIATESSPSVGGPSRGDGVVIDLRAVGGEPPGWVMLITSSFEIERPSGAASDRRLVFHPAPASSQRRFRYHHGRLVEAAGP